MSTKATVSDGYDDPEVLDYHLFTDYFDEGDVFLEIPSECECEHCETPIGCERCGETTGAKTIRIPLTTWRHIVKGSEALLRFLEANEKG